MKMLAKNNRKTTLPVLSPSPGGPQPPDASAYLCLLSVVALASASLVELLASFSSLGAAGGGQPIYAILIDLFRNYRNEISELI